MKAFLVLSSLICWSVNSLITPYTWIDFDRIHSTGVWKNDNSVRTQQVTDGGTFILNLGPTTTATDNYGNLVGVFDCYSGGQAIAFLPSATYNSFALEVIVQITAEDVSFPSYIIGMEGAGENHDGNGIGFNEVTGKTSAYPNTFFPVNIAQNGWHAPLTYFAVANYTQDINTNEFYHVIISQDSNGFVNVYVNGKPYGGTNYVAPSGPNIGSTTSPSINICGSLGIAGFSGIIRAFGFYVESVDSHNDAYDLCMAANMTQCTPGCTLGVGYGVEGIGGYAHGDPHFRTFNGEYHDFMGSQISLPDITLLEGGGNYHQYYYMHPCLNDINGGPICREDMPFTLLGQHYAVPWNDWFTSLDYITFELFDVNGDKYHLWLSTSFAICKN